MDRRARSAISSRLIELQIGLKNYDLSPHRKHYSCKAGHGLMMLFGMIEASARQALQRNRQTAQCPAASDDRLHSGRRSRH